MPAASPTSRHPTPHPPHHAGQQQLAEAVLAAEADAVRQIAIGPAFHEAVDLILNRIGPDTHGSLVVSGLGKSGIVGQKLSATFSSTGTPSHFLHVVEAMHGDLGRIRRGDVVLVLSYSGRNDEVITLASILRQDGVPVIAIVGVPECDLGRLAAIALPIGDIDEACPHNLAPTATTTAMLALGDALALCVSRRRNFGADDFKRVHPGGGLGRQLVPCVEAMRFRAAVNLPLIAPSQTIRDAYAAVERMEKDTGLRRAGALLVVDDAGHLAGIFTDGDLRRHVFRGGNLDTAISEAMTTNPRRLPHTAVVRDAVQLVRELRIDEVPVVDSDGKPLGLIDVQDLVALKLIEG